MASRLFFFFRSSLDILFSYNFVLTFLLIREILFNNFEFCCYIFVVLFFILPYMSGPCRTLKKEDNQKALLSLSGAWGLLLFTIVWCPFFIYFFFSPGLTFYLIYLNYFVFLFLFFIHNLIFVLFFPSISGPAD